MIQEESPADSIPHQILHVDSANGILRIVQDELRSIWGNRIQITSFTDGETAARHVLFQPDFSCDAAIIDSNLLGPVSARDLILTILDCHPACLIVLARPPQAAEDSSFPALPNIQLLDTPFQAEQLITLLSKVISK